MERRLSNEASSLVLNLAFIDKWRDFARVNSKERSRSRSGPELEGRRLEKRFTQKAANEQLESAAMYAAQGACIGDANESSD